MSRLFDLHGKPVMIRSDNGCEFVTETVKDWLTVQGVRPVFIAKASPSQNCWIEGSSGSMRNELLNAETSPSITEAQVVINEVLESYKTFRPHRALGIRMQAAFYAGALPHHEAPP